MADITKLIPILFNWEGGFVNDPIDKGGATNMGVTLATWKSMGYDKDHDGDIDVEDIKLLTKDDVIGIARRYWNVWQADHINNQSIANILVDWVWGSGAWGVKVPQRLMGLKVDGVVGVITLNTVNTANPQDLFDKIKAARIKFVEDICVNNKSQLRFLKGWKNRINSFKFAP